MTPHARASLPFGMALALLQTLPFAPAQSQPWTPEQRPPQWSRSVTGVPPAQAESRPAHPRLPSRSSAAAPASQAEMPTVSKPRTNGPVAEISLGDIGFVNGIHFANLGGHRELFIPLPQDGDATASELNLVIDDLTAHDAKRTLEVRINDRTVTTIALDGKSQGRTLGVPLGNAKPKDGYLKLSFLYSGAATPDHCVDVRSVGDSLTIRPETAIAIDIGAMAALDVATIAALMPHDVTIVLPERSISATDLATAIIVARAIVSSGRRVTFYHGHDGVADLAKPGEEGRWTRGIVIVGPLADAIGLVDAPLAKIAGDVRDFGTINAVRIGGLPALVISDGESVRAGRLFASPLLAATSGMSSASVGKVSPLPTPTDRVTFDQLEVPLEQVEVFGRAELTETIDTKRLPGGTRPTRLALDLMVAPDGAGARAVVSVFVNERLIGSTVAATTEATHLDLVLPDGLVGTVANLRVVIERDIAQGDCRFGPQGYPAQILGSSAFVLAGANAAVHDFSDLTARFARDLEIVLPPAAADQPEHVLGMVADVVAGLSPDTGPLDVRFGAAGGEALAAPFIAVGDAAPEGSAPRVRFDRGRVAVVDPSGRTLLDLGGFVDGAVAQVVMAGKYPGIWIKPMTADGSLPAPPELHLDRGDVAFVNSKGVTLAMSTERDTVVKISYPDQVSWLTVAERFRFWIIAGLWLFATAALLLTLQRVFRRRPAAPSE